MQDDEELENQNGQDSDVQESDSNINNRELSSSKGIRGFLKNPITSIVNKIKGFFGKNKGPKIANVFSAKTKLIILGIVIFIIFIIVIIVAVAEAASSSAVATREAGVESLGINENSSEMDKNALKLYENYDSLIGFTNEQLNKIYQTLKDNENSRNKYLVSSGGKEIGSGNNLYSVDGKKTLYEHIQRTEKYNFNNILWKEYSHNVDGQEMSTENREDLGLKVPTGVDDKTLMTLMETTSPYLLTNDIPLGMLCGLVAYSTTSIDDPSTSEKLTYEIIKEAQTKLTVNKYVLQSVKKNTVREEYETISYSGNFTVSVNPFTREVKVISAPNYQQSGEGIPNNPQEIQVGDSSTSEEIFWYVSEAKTYDAKLNNEFDYTRYNENDVNNLTNPDSNILTATNEINRIVSGSKISSSDIPNNLYDLIDKFNLPNGISFESLFSENKTVTLNYNIGYTVEIGTSYSYEKEWKDKCSPKASNNNTYTYNDLKEYNTKEDETYNKIPTDKEVIDEKDFNAEEPYKRYEEEDSTVLYGLSFIDFLDSNKGTYLKYLASQSAAYSDFVGLSRNNMKEGYRQVKNILNTLADKIEKANENGAQDSEGNISSINITNSDKKVLPFVYGSSLGYEVTNISIQSNTTSNFVSGMDLLRQYIFSHEGTGPSVTQNADGVDCYTAYADSGGNITIGHGINLTGNPGYMQQLQEEYGTITVGTLIPVEAVETIENEMVKTFYDKVKNGTNGIELEEYQIHALTSFAYNYKDINFSKFTAYFNDPSYWNQEVDNRYEEVYEKYKDNQTAVSQIQSEANLNTGMYKDFFAPIIYDNKKNLLPGLVTRRRSEYILFSLGYYDTLQRFWAAGGTNLAGIELLNADGSINYDNVQSLQLWYEQELFVNGPSAPLNPNPGNIYKTKGNAAKYAHSINSFNEQYRQFLNATGTYGSPNYPRVIPTNEYFQCTWWAEFMGYYFLYSSSGGEITEPFGKGSNLGNGNMVASNLSRIYGVPTYTVDQLEVGKHYILSSNSINHVIYIEAVGNTELVVSHCGSAESWYGVSAISRSSSQVRGTYVCMEDLLATYGY